jgi:hypothetical protein
MFLMETIRFDRMSYPDLYERLTGFWSPITEGNNQWKVMLAAAT